MSKTFAQSQWGTVKGVSMTISGCGPCALASIAYNLDNSLTPKDTATWLANKGYFSSGGTTRTGMTEGIKHYGFDCDYYKPEHSGGTIWKNVMDNIKSQTGDWWAIFLVVGKSNGGKDNLWTSGGHFLAITDYKDGKLYVRDSGSRGRTGYYDPETLRYDTNCVWIIKRKDDTTKYKKCLDISTFDTDKKPINWDKVKAEGIKSVVIRAGLSKEVDENFVEHIEAAIKEGMNIGIYWFCYSWTEAQAKAEADYCIKALKPYRDYINMPVFFDAEADTYRYAKEQGHDISDAVLNKMAVKFCETIKAAGYVPGIYFNKDYRLNKFTSTTLAKYMRWYAYYNSSLDWTDCHLWQFTDKAEVDGVYPEREDVNCIVDESIIQSRSAATTEKKKVKADYIEGFQLAVNASYGEHLVIDRSYGPLCREAAGKYFLYYRKLSVIKNAHVSWYQDCLKALGYDIIVDGCFGPDAEKVTIQFQREHGLTPDGYVGMATHQTIVNLL